MNTQQINPLQEVTVLHWLALMPILSHRAWIVQHGRIRTEQGDCPLVALAAEVMGPEAVAAHPKRLFMSGGRAYSAWGIVLDTAMGVTDGMSAIIRAADYPEEAPHTRRMLMQALGMQPDC